MRKEDLQFAPRDIFERILEYAVIHTFDLIVWFSDRGAILLRRRIAPYKNTWALPGLRMMKPEGIEDTLIRIARNEIGITIDPTNRRFIGQYVGRFRTEQNRKIGKTCLRATQYSAMHRTLLSIVSISAVIVLSRQRRTSPPKRGLCIVSF